MTYIYSPAQDSFLIKKCLKGRVQDKVVLDMGTGSGILAIASLQLGAEQVYAADINSSALKLIKEKRIKKIKSDLFSKIKSKFEVIIFNPPYLPADAKEDKQSALAHSGGKRGDEIIIKFIKRAKSHLTKDGTILLLLSSLTPLDKITPLLAKLKLSSNEIASEKFFFERLFVLEIKRKQ